MQTRRSLALQQDRCFKRAEELPPTSFRRGDGNSTVSTANNQLVGLARPRQPVQLLRAGGHQLCPFHLRGKRIPCKGLSSSGVVSIFTCGPFVLSTAAKHKIHETEAAQRQSLLVRGLEPKRVTSLSLSLSLSLSPMLSLLRHSMLETLLPDVSVKMEHLPQLLY